MSRVLKSLGYALCGLALGGLSPLALAADPVEADRIVAVVGTEVVTLHDLQARLKTIQKQLSKQGTALPPRDVLEKQVLERMIVDRAQVQLGREMGMQVDDQQLDEAIARIAASNKQTAAQFRKSVEKDGLTYAQFREELRNEIAISRVRQREVDNRLVIADSEVDNYLSMQKAKGANEEYHLAHILVRAAETATPEQLQKLRVKVEQAIKRIQAGENFAQLAATFSDAPDAMQGGDLGWRTVDRIPSLFVAAVADLKPGQVSEVVRSPAGFHLIKLVDRRGVGANAPPVQQTHARHILIKVNELVSAADAKHKLELLRDRLVHGGDFAELARLYSQDGSAPKGGDLGWLYPGDTVPEFERAMDELKPHVVSQVVQSPFGFHLIEVIERKTQDISDERKRAAARSALRERKLEEAYEDWVRQLRDRTYVEYRLDDR